MKTKFNVKEIKELIYENTSRYFGKTPTEVSDKQMLQAVCTVVRDILTNKRVDFKKQIKNQNAKKVYYLSMEFLLGRSLKNYLFNLDLTKEFSKALDDYGFDINNIYSLEADPGLGNGGLGRLAAAFMESLTSCNYPAIGFSIRYDYGVFYQKIVDGWQVELPDKWLKKGMAWLSSRTEDVFEVKIGGKVKETWKNGKLKIEHTDYTSICAVPYDMNIAGYSDYAVNKLRLWSARASNDFDMSLFSQGQYIKAMEEKTIAETISKVLYPADNHLEGKSLRLKQQYFFVSASIQNIVRNHLKNNKNLDNLPDCVAIHINDTHPALCVPELMRILIDDYDYSWDKAYKIVKQTISYTNHTVLAEALETWPCHLFNLLLPRIFKIIEEINTRHCKDLLDYFKNDSVCVAKNAIISYDQINMANLCLVSSHKINGVSKLHTEILKKDLFSDYYKLAPEKFMNVTNGITHRRWLAVANPRLTEFLTDLIGDEFMKYPTHLENLLKYKNDLKVLEKLREIKQSNKIDLSNYILEKKGIKIDPNSIFDVQAKRLHEYKRQLLNVLNIIYLYYTLKQYPSMDFVPRTFIFSAKAASNYTMAKQIIKLIVMLSEVVNNDKSIKDKIKIVFLENYCVSLAELIIPASDVSEQISLAGKEASGTGNMKFMLNGAVTIGTMDGANVEIFEEVGKENIFIFGLTAKEVEKLYKDGYNPTMYYQNNDNLKFIISKLRSEINGVDFSDIADSLLFGKPMADPYMVLADFESYKQTQLDLSLTYLDKEKFQKMSLVNIAKAGHFSSDRSVKEYAEKIWGLKNIKDD